MKLKKDIRLWICILFFLVSLVFILKPLLLDYLPDFSIFYLGTKAAFSGINPYLSSNHFYANYIYPPASMIFFLPFTLLSFTVSEKLWLATSIFAYFLSVYYILKINKAKIFSPSSLLLTGLVNIYYFPLKFTLGMGQVNLFILLLFVVSVYFFLKNKIYRSGFFISLSLFLKPFALFLIPYLILKKKWKALFAVTLAAVFLVITGCLMVRLDINRYFYKNVALGLLSGWKGDYYNQALTGFLFRLTGDLLLRERLKVIVSAVLLALSFYALIKKHKKDNLRPGLEISFLVILTLIISSFSWQHHFVFMLYSFFTTFYFLRSKEASLYLYLLLGVSFFLVGFNFKNPSQVNILLQSHVFYGSLILWFLNYHLLK